MENDTSQELVQFLRQTAPTIETMLERNIFNHILKEYDAPWEEEVRNISQLIELKPPLQYQDQFSGTSVSWNSTGSMIACAYGRFDHNGWCTHSGHLGAWHAFRSKIQTEKPDFFLETTVKFPKKS